MTDSQQPEPLSNDELRRMVMRPIPTIPLRTRLYEGFHHGNWRPRRAVRYLPVKRRWYQAPLRRLKREP